MFVEVEGVDTAVFRGYARLVDHFDFVAALVDPRGAHEIGALADIAAFTDFRDLPDLVVNFAIGKVRILDKLKMLAAHLPEKPKGRCIVVGAGKGAVRILELQKAGGKRLAATEFIKGFPLERETFA